MLAHQLFQTLRGRFSIAPPCPEQPLVVVGDVHGCYDLLLDLLGQIPQGMQIVFLGDYIDRGRQSAEVLRFLQDQPDLICLRGNHEDMLLRFLEDPARYGMRWLQHGGWDTLASFGILGLARDMDEEAFVRCRDALAAEMSDGLLEWLKALPASYRSGNIFAAHAGANPAVALDQQNPQHLIWGHPKFGKRPRRDGVWVVHGHVIQEDPLIARGRIAVDTGAYATGVLSAAYIAAGEKVRFLQVKR